MLQGKAAALPSPPPLPTPAGRAPHVGGEPGAEPLADDLLLGQGFVCSRAAPSLLCTEKSALNTRVYKKQLINFKREKRSYFSFLIPLQDLNLSHYQSKDG